MFHGATPDQAVRQAQAACGADAIILHQTRNPRWHVWRPRWTVAIAVEPSSATSFQSLVPPSLRASAPGSPEQGTVASNPSAPGPTLPSSARPASPSRVVLDHADRDLLRSVLHAVQSTQSVEASWTWPETWPLRIIPTTGLQRIACIGPTGAGKTTTIGKLAAWSALRDHHPTQLLTTDTFRAGAAAQLQQFARVLRISCAVVGSGQPLPDAVAAATTGRWFLDTPGVTAREPYRLAEIQAWLHAFQPTLVYVVLPASLDPERFAALATLFQSLTETPPALILTKVDEVDDLTKIAQVVQNLGWAWSYLGTGQTVPDDLVPATLEAVQGWSTPPVMEVTG